MRGGGRMSTGTSPRGWGTGTRGRCAISARRSGSVGRPSPRRWRSLHQSWRRTGVREVVRTRECIEVQFHFCFGGRFVLLGSSVAMRSEPPLGQAGDRLAEGQVDRPVPVAEGQVPVAVGGGGVSALRRGHLLHALDPLAQRLGRGPRQGRGQLSSRLPQVLLGQPVRSRGRGPARDHRQGPCPREVAGKKRRGSHLSSPARALHAT
mmetsp:Transcript_4606/g.16125  ORF Transcript_4606/g.16125 Transcript_4606/m.16125 type:complete len:207 (+) Transcript_4606:731-1351(+)